MRIYTFVEQYPCPYKPYYDAQFADLLRKGHELTIFATARIDRTLNEKVRRYRLAERIRYMPPTLRGIPARLPAIVAGAAALGRRAPARVGIAGAAAGGVRARATGVARALVLGSGRPDLCLVHSLGAAALVPWLREVYPGVPVALYYHGGEVPLVQPLGDDVAEQAFALADVVFTNTDFSRRHAIQRGCPPDRLSILPVGLPLEDYVVPAGRAYRPGGTLRLLSAGRMSEEKGYIFALQALKRVVERGERNVRYSMTGEGYLKPRLEAYVRENGLEPYVRFLGVLSTAGVLEAMADADALLLPSIQVGNWVENQACAVQEALLMGALAVTSRTGGVPESIPPEMQRFVVPPGDPAALAEAVLQLAEMPAAAIEAEAAVCRRYVAERYDASRLNERLLAETVAVGQRRRPAAVAAPSEPRAPLALDGAPGPTRAGAGGPLRIYAFVEQYPSAYKPYYDAQFADFLRKGHDVAIFATGTIDRVVNDKVHRFGLAGRTTYLPEILRKVPPRLPAIVAGAAALGRRAPRRARTAAAAVEGWRARVTAAARALMLPGTPPDLCLIHTLTTSAQLPWLRALYPGVPVAIYFHGGEVPQVPRVDDEAAQRGFSVADIVFSNTAASCRQAIERGCAPERAAVLPVGFALEDYVLPPGREYRPGGRLRLISVGRMTDEKGLIHALEALKQVVESGERRVTYTLVGDGYLRPSLEAYVRAHGLAAHVQFLGVLSNGDVREALAGADALLLPSIPSGNCAETQACAVQEAMLMGALVITTRTGGVPESIPPEMARFVVPPGDSAALARAILQFAALPTEAIRAEAAVCRRFVMERYDVARLNEELLRRTLHAGARGGMPVAAEPEPAGAGRPEPAALRSTGT